MFDNWQQKYLFVEILNHETKKIRQFKDKFD